MEGYAKFKLKFSIITNEFLSPHFSQVSIVYIWAQPKTDTFMERMGLGVLS